MENYHIPGNSRFGILLLNKYNMLAIRTNRIALRPPSVKHFLTDIPQLPDGRSLPLFSRHSLNFITSFPPLILRGLFYFQEDFEEDFEEGSREFFPRCARYVHSSTESLGD